MLARQQLLANARGPRKALVASNAGNSLPLLETFRATRLWNCETPVTILPRASAMTSMVTNCAA